jgi:CRISPR/Cas system CMR-associated protein Cmr3 (group 5 of RAMP superfamily)
MVKKPDGSFMLVSDAELAQLKKENKIGVEVPKTMAGKFTDLTQKPIIILKE